MKEDALDPKTRAEDIILGSVGLGESAQLLSVLKKETGYSGQARFPDGQIFEFNYEEELDELQNWALKFLEENKK